MAVTAKDLAKKLNLSEAAVSMALNHKPGVSTKTRQRVLQTAEEMGFDLTKRTEAVKKPPVRQGTVTLIIYKKHGAIVTDSPFFSQLTEGIQQGCKQADYSLNICYFYEEDDIEKQLKALPYCNGIILLATEMRAEDFKPFYNLSLPLVVLDTYYDSLPWDCVLINNLQGAFSATNYIIQHTKSQPGYLRSAYPIGNFNERADGFFRAIRANGMSASKSQMLYLTPSTEGAYADMCTLLQSGEEPVKCYFADNDSIAIGAIKAFREAGYRIPQDISIIGFDNIPLCTYVDPSLTTIHVPKQYMGRMAVQRLIQTLQETEHYPTKFEIGTNLIKRNSIG